jgi:hypothetical protein
MTGAGRLRLPYDAHRSYDLNRSDNKGEDAMRHRTWLALGLALALLAGCGSSGPKRDINDPTNSLVFGYIDMSDAPTGVDYAWLMRVAPPSKTPYWQLGVRKGLFYNTHLPTGSYQISRFGGSAMFAGQHRYDFPRQANETALRVEKPGIYYLGSYKYKKVKTGVFEQGKFAIEKVESPTEAELLKRLLDESAEVKGTAWEDKVRARLAKLKR